MTDRIIQFLSDHGWKDAIAQSLSEPTDALAELSLAMIASLVVRALRDDIALANLDGKVGTFAELDAYLNRRASQLWGYQTVTGDTTT
jgi:hypothetical protein